MQRLSIIKSCHGVYISMRTAVRLCCSNIGVRGDDFPMIKASRGHLQDQHAQERHQWKRKEKDMVSLWKKGQLKLEEKVNEEQVKMCETLSVEKKKREKAQG